MLSCCVLPETKRKMKMTAMLAVHWYNHSRGWLEEYYQSLKYIKKHEHIPPAQQANKPTERNPVVDQKIISRTKTSVKKNTKTKTLQPW